MKRFYYIAFLAGLFVMQTSFAQTNSQSFIQAGTYKFTVPKGATTLTVSLAGAGGWGGGSYGSLYGQGGGGGLVKGDIDVKEGEIILILVGNGGGPGKAGAITAILRDKEYLAIAAAGGNGAAHGGKGGSGGPQGRSGTAGSGNFHSGNGGTGASAINGGNGGNAGSSGIRGTNGTALKGGTNNAKATGEGWGGAGWFGGGAAGTYGSAFLIDDPFASGGGGGGCNYTKGLKGAITNASGVDIAGGRGGNMGMGGRVDIIWK